MASFGNQIGGVVPSPRPAGITPSPYETPRPPTASYHRAAKSRVHFPVSIYPPQQNPNTGFPHGVPDGRQLFRWRTDRQRENDACGNRSNAILDEPETIDKP